MADSSDCHFENAVHRTHRRRGPRWAFVGLILILCELGCQSVLANSLQHRTDDQDPLSKTVDQSALSSEEDASPGRSGGPIEFLIRPFLEIPTYVKEKCADAFLTSEQLSEASSFALQNRESKAGPNVGEQRDSEDPKTGINSEADGSAKSKNDSVDVKIVSAKSDRVTPDPTDAMSSRLRAVRSMRIIIFIVGIMTAIGMAKLLLHLNQLSHGNYAGRLQVIGWLIITVIMIVALALAWNDDFWEPMTQVELTVYSGQQEWFAAEFLS